MTKVVVDVPVDYDGNITVRFNGTDYPVNIANGTGSIYVPATPGDSVDIIFENSTCYEDNNCSVVVPHIKDYDVGVVVAFDGNMTKVVVDVPVDYDGNVTVRFNGADYSVNIANGMGSVFVPATPGDSVEVMLENSSCYGDINKTSIVLIKDYPFDINVIGLSNSTAVVDVSVLENYDGNVTVRFNGADYHVTVVNGTGSIVVPASAGDILEVDLSNSSYYGDVNRIVPVKIKDYPMNVSVVDNGNGTGTLNVTVPQDYDGNVTVIVNNISYPVTVINGTGSIVVPMSSDKSVVVVFDNSTRYDDRIINTTASNVDDGVVISGNRDRTVYYLQSLRYTVRILDSTGKPVHGARVVFSIGNNKYAVSDSNGYASVNLNLKPGTYKITATTTSNGREISVSNVIKVKSIIRAKKTTKIKKSKKKTIIKITLKGHKVKQTVKVKFTYKGKNKVKVKFGKSIKKQTVIVKFKGKSYKVKVNTKGKGTLKLTKKVAKKLKRSKKYSIKVTYKGSKRYKKVKVKVKFNGKKYKVKTNSKGVGKFKVTKKMVKKFKKGKKVKYTISYKKDKLNRYVKIK